MGCAAMKTADRCRRGMFFHPWDFTLSILPTEHMFSAARLFDKAEIALPEGKSFRVIAENNSKENLYIQSATLNGKPYEKSFITHKDIMNGGELVFQMGSTPNMEYGKAPDNRPKSGVY
jgi:putative alpha-1,2-mannosidase